MLIDVFHTKLIIDKINGILIAFISVNYHWRRNKYQMLKQNFKSLRFQ